MSETKTAIPTKGDVAMNFAAILSHSTLHNSISFPLPDNSLLSPCLYYLVFFFLITKKQLIWKRMKKKV